MPHSATKNYYFDYAAATPLDSEVLEAMMPFLTERFANPSSLYASARTNRVAVEAARHSISTLLGARPTEIVFTSGGTESNNLAIQGVLRAHPDATWVTTAIEHDAVLQIAAGAASGTVVPPAPDGIVRTEALVAAITDQTVLISVMYANNEIGTIQPLSDIAADVAAIRADRARRGVDLPLYFHTDAVQAALYLSLQVDRLGVDLISLSGSKMYGPKGTGLLYVRRGTALAPLFAGGGQERGRRSGTENIAGIVGLAKALALAGSVRASESRRLKILSDQLWTSLERKFPDCILNGSRTKRLPSNINVTLPGVDGETLILYLDERGIQASTGSACSTGSLDPSHVLLALGRSIPEARGSLRLTMGKHTTIESVASAVGALEEVVPRLRRLQSA